MLTVAVHTQHEPTLEGFIKSMEQSGFHLHSRRHTGLVWTMKFHRP